MGRAVLSRDDLVKIVLTDDFYRAVPELVSVQELVQQARASWDASCRASCCGGDVRILYPAMDHLLALLRAHPKSDANDRVRQFFCAWKGKGNGSAVLYYRKSTKGLPDRIEL